MRCTCSWQHIGEDAARVVVVCETCDAAGWVHDLSAALGFAVNVANCCHEAWRWNKVKRKTDKDDALKLAKMALLDQLPIVHMPSAQMRQGRRLVLHRRTLVQRRTQVKNSVRSIFSQQGLTQLLPRGKKAWSGAGVQQLREHAKPLADPPSMTSGVAGLASSWKCSRRERAGRGGGEEARQAGRGR